MFKRKKPAHEPAPVRTFCDICGALAAAPRTDSAQPGAVIWQNNRCARHIGTVFDKVRGEYETRSGAPSPGPEPPPFDLEPRMNLIDHETAFGDKE